MVWGKGLIIRKKIFFYYSRNLVVGQWIEKLSQRGELKKLHILLTCPFNVNHKCTFIYHSFEVGPRTCLGVLGLQMGLPWSLSCINNTHNESFPVWVFSSGVVS